METGARAPLEPGPAAGGRSPEVLPGAGSFSAPGREQGPGSVAVLLCHGFTGSPRSLRPWAQDLAAAGLTVELPRLPGHGTTWQDMATTTWAQWSAAVEAALAALVATGARVVVGGLSMGGGLALRLAADHPEDVAALVLVNPATLLTDPRAAAVPVLRRLRPSLPGIGSDTANGAPEGAYGHVPLAALASSLAGYAGLRADLHRVVAPLTVLRSATDHVVPAASTSVVLAGVSSRSVREVVLARSFHVATLDHDAPAITRATLEVVETVRASLPAAPQGTGGRQR